MDTIDTRFTELESIQDWEYAKPTKEFIQNMREYTKQIVDEIGVSPYIFPTIYGCIQLEWDIYSGSIELEAKPDQDKIIWSGLGIDEEELEETEDFEAVVIWLSEEIEP